MTDVVWGAGCGMMCCAVFFDVAWCGVLGVLWCAWCGAVCFVRCGACVVWCARCGALCLVWYYVVLNGVLWHGVAWSGVGGECWGAW